MPPVIRLLARGIIVAARLRADGTIEITVEDDGPGVPASERTSVFGMFNRRASDVGAGLGLAIAKAFVEAHRRWWSPRLGCTPSATGRRSPSTSREKKYTDLHALVVFSGTVYADGLSFTEPGLNRFLESQTADRFGEEYQVLIVASDGVASQRPLYMHMRWFAHGRSSHLESRERSLDRVPGLCRAPQRSHGISAGQTQAVSAILGIIRTSA